jgi:hypothetical protein
MEEVSSVPEGQHVFYLALNYDDHHFFLLLLVLLDLLVLLVFVLVQAFLKQLCVLKFSTIPHTRILA